MVGAAAVVLSSEALPLVVGWAFALLLRLVARPVVADVTERSTRRD